MGQTMTSTPPPQDVVCDNEKVEECLEAHGKGRLSITVLGASGDLAKKKTYPALLDLFSHNLIPRHVCIVGFARSAQSSEDFRTYLRPWLLKVNGKSNGVDKFLARCWVFKGSYDNVDDFLGLHLKLLELENTTSPPKPAIINRLFYFAIPPDVFLKSAQSIKQSAMSPSGFNRIIVEKPFGHDLPSALKLASDLNRIVSEDVIYRIDHYLGKEMIQNLMTFRFANGFLGPLFSKASVASVRITVKEDFGTEGRGGYFTNYGIIRDIIQNHIMQVLSVVAMEKPLSTSGNAKRDAKVAVINAIKPIDLDNVVIGQYVGGGGKPGYLDDDSIEDKVKAQFVPTFAAIVLYMDNPRWLGVPFLLKAGKAVDERKAEIRIQFKDAAGANTLFGGSDELARNELVMRLQPMESIYLKAIVKAPGLQTVTQQAELDLTYKSRFKDAYSPDAYTRLLLESLRGNQGDFVRGDEIIASWRVFDPLLRQLEEGSQPEAKKCWSHCFSPPPPKEVGPRMPLPYVYGSRGPPEAEKLFERHGFRYGKGYKWTGDYE
jgi:glucose-6-phosphate 1-dehydrogenase